ncbi:MAG: AAA family ATPase [Methanocorpusculum sp.]|jgi:putative ATP-dependent endonuclease of OLD family|nr:AAA family ATPase [Methanocorpusculum sp.]MDD2470226.1 AAA family ATPase [Methanocorpusculum sp.]MDD3256997.1 AAA family ATPase [Methanocorpusculum sp.]
MYLQSMQISGFRAISKLKLVFNEKLNVIIGENNIGKTAVIDALRICLEYGQQSQNKLYITSDDFHHDDNGQKTNIITFDLTFTPDPEEEGVYYEYLAVDPKDRKRSVQIHHRYTLETRDDEEKVRKKIWGGESEENYISENARDLINCIHVGALRNAEHDLRPVRNGLLGELFRKQITDPKKREEVVKEIKNALSNTQTLTNEIEIGKNKINNLIEQMNMSRGLANNQNVDLKLTDFDFEKLVDSIYMTLPPYEEDRFSLKRNGLGYNNIIYVATILAKLKLREPGNKNYYGLLIEEPESHLHPQLQRTFFDYLSTHSEKNLQTFVTSHSPTITSTTDLDSLIILNRNNNENHAFVVGKAEFKPNSKKYLKKFFDVTRNQLFFAQGVILVEGISEELLIGIFADMLGEREGEKGKYDFHKNGIEIVNVNGISFGHYAPLFNSGDPEKSMNIRAAIITDDDGKCDPATQKLENHNLKVMIGKITFEYELYNESNHKILMTVLDQISEGYSKIFEEKYISDDMSKEEKAKCFKDFIAKHGSKNHKSDFALALAIHLQENITDRANFIIPAYIQKAIKWVTIDDDI